MSSQAMLPGPQMLPEDSVGLASTASSYLSLAAWQVPGWGLGAGPGHAQMMG